MPHHFSLPSGSLDQPPGSQFHMVVIHGINRQCRILFRQGVRDSTFNHRVFKKTPGIRQNFHVRQLRLPYTNNGLAYRFQRRFAQTGYFILHAPVVQLKLGMFRQTERDIRYQKTILPLMLENRIPVTETTCCRVNRHLFSLHDIHGFHPVNTFPDFHPVSPDILHRGCSHMAGNQ